MQLVTAPVVATIGKPTQKQGVVWYTPSGQELMVRFDVFLEGPGVDPDSWPSKDATGSTFTGRILVADGGTACVVAREEGSDHRIRFPESAKAEVFGVMANLRSPWLFAVGEAENDGHIVVLDIPVEPPPRRTSLPHHHRNMNQAAAPERASGNRREPRFRQIRQALRESQ